MLKYDLSILAAIIRGVLPTRTGISCNSLLYFRSLTYVSTEALQSMDLGPKSEQLLILVMFAATSKSTHWALIPEVLAPSRPVSCLFQMFCLLLQRSNDLASPAMKCLTRLTRVLLFESAIKGCKTIIYSKTDSVTHCVRGTYSTSRSCQGLHYHYHDHGYRCPCGSSARHHQTGLLMLD